MTPKITKLSGPALQVSGMESACMNEVVAVGDEKLLGEVIRIEKGVATVQLYEETFGLCVGDPVNRTEKLLSMELGPGLLGSIFDGIGRPLPELAAAKGAFIARGATAPSLDREKKWRFEPKVRPGEMVSPGMIIGVVQETTMIEHKILVPAGCEGVIATIAEEGEYKVTDKIATLDDGTGLDMRQTSSVHTARKVARRLPLNTPLITGQRVLDTLFPVAEGGIAIVPGGFGSGKTVLEQAIAKFSNADVIVYVGCGERGNEMAGVLEEFPKLEDPHTGRPMMERTILVANTSNMPVAAREASIYTGVTIAEYYRDMGYRVALLADSTSRWAEALREISSRMEEMPGEEGYPTYLPSRLGAFYERAGRMSLLGREEETGSVTIIGAVSPPGGDFSEPVTQASIRVASTFWALDYSLAHQRHFPAVDWLSSFSLTAPKLYRWFASHADPKWDDNVASLNNLLQREKELSEIVQIVGLDSLGDIERTEYEAARILREGYLRQSGFHPDDAYCSILRQAKILGALLEYSNVIINSARSGVDAEKIIDAPMTESYIRLMEIKEEFLGEEIERLRDVTRDYLEKEEGG